MNEWCIFYIALYSVLLYTQSALQSCGGGGGVSPYPPSVVNNKTFSLFFPAANHIRMIFEGSRDTEDWSNDADSKNQLWSKELITF